VKNIWLTSRHVAREIVIEFAMGSFANFSLSQKVTDMLISCSSIVIKLSILLSLSFPLISSPFTLEKRERKGETDLILTF